jgi:hypothetical protein
VAAEVAEAESVEVYRAFEPFARLTQRSATLDGAVPLRVVQACVPFLEGNSAGLQVTFERRLTVRTRIGRVQFADDDARRHVDAVLRALVPLYVERELLRRGGPWHQQLSRGWSWTERGVLRVWTGLLVRPPPGAWLRVSDAGNRRPLGLAVRRTYVAGDELVPLVVDFVSPRDGARLEGEVATVLAVPHSTGSSIVGVSDAPELALAHASFYDARYFGRKTEANTKKYRRLVSREVDAPARTSAGERAYVKIAHVAGPPPEWITVRHALGAHSPRAASAPDGQGVGLARFRNAVGFRAQFDGNTFDVQPEAKELERGAKDVRQALERAMGEGWALDHKGALLYLTKYFTPHPKGEPHFFVKPWAFVATPPGWSVVVEAAEGFSASPLEVMRGAVWTDRFHAVPAVFHATGDRAARVRAGEPLVDVVAVPRRLLALAARVHEVA